MKPKISVLIPIYNTAKYLRECLDSLINQTIKDIEFICLNDGSTDESSSILEEYCAKDKRIKVINKKNSGYGHTMNIGLSTAQGEYIGIVESDDFVKNTMYENLYKIAQKFNADIVKSDFYHYSTQKNMARKAGIIAKFSANKIVNIQKMPNIVKIQPSIWSAVYKKEFLNNNNINFLQTEGASYQDTSFSFKALCKGKRTILTTEAYLYYRIDNENSSVNSIDKIFSICREFDEIDNFLNSNSEIKEIVNAQKLIKQYSAYMWNLKRINEKFRSDFITSFSNTFKKYLKNNEIDKQFYKKYSKKTINDINL